MKLRLHGCSECSIDHHHACPWAAADDERDWSTVYCCCGRAVDPKTTAAEYADYGEELRRRGWSHPTNPDTKASG